MSEHRFVITDRLWQSIAPLLPGKATDRGATPRPDDPVRTTPPLEAPLCAGASAADGPANSNWVTCCLPGSNPLPNEVAWAKVGRSSFTTCGCAVSDGGQAGRWADMKKGAARPPVHTTSGEDQKVRVGRTAMAKASALGMWSTFEMKSR